ncbi:MAG: metallophosphoesterase [Gemmatimonadaceae bacterium]|nr:metallophosphoesterase [Gemmatimonadaceae bacterium]
MRIGLMSDTHDRVDAVAELAKRMAAGGVGYVIHAGDFCAPFSLRPIQDLQLALSGVFGRNDGDHEALRAMAMTGLGSELFESPHSFELMGRSILVVHDINEAAARSIEAHDIVIHGCTHREEMKTRGTTLLVNPGEACGWLHGAPTAAILDLESRQVEIIKLTESNWSTR